jgi:hypothetical protein
MPIQISKNPYAYQAVKPECIGWFLDPPNPSTAKKLVPEIRRTLNIPSYVAIGLQWRTIKNEHKKTYKWEEDCLPPQAQHLDIDYHHTNRFSEPAARLWCKGAKNRVDCLQLCLIPCLGSTSAVAALSDNQHANILLMAAKQQFFSNYYIVKLDNSHILNLDAPVEYATLKVATLRKYLMSRAPTSSVIHRIFVSVDRSWCGNDFTLVTVKPYAADAFKALNCMIPECTYLYGEAAAKKWFSNAGLLAYQNVNWDPTTQATTSHQDHATQALVKEDLFHIGTSWKSQAPIMKPQAARPEDTGQQYTVQNLLAAPQTDTDIHSFGSVYDRQHDGESVATEQQPPPLPTNVIVQIDPDLEPTVNKKPDDDRSYDASSASFTTNSTRRNLCNEKATNANLLNENHELAA